MEHGGQIAVTVPMKQSSFASGEKAIGCMADKVSGTPNERTGKAHQGAGKAAVGNDQMQAKSIHSPGSQGRCPEANGRAKDVIKKVVSKA